MKYVFNLYEKPRIRKSIQNKFSRNINISLKVFLYVSVFNKKKQSDKQGLVKLIMYNNKNFALY